MNSALVAFWVICVVPVAGSACAQTASSAGEQAIRPQMAQMLEAANAHDTDVFMSTMVRSPHLIFAFDGEDSDVASDSARQIAKRKAAYQRVRRDLRVATPAHRLAHRVRPRILGEASGLAQGPAGGADIVAVMWSLWCSRRINSRIF